MESKADPRLRIPDDEAGPGREYSLLDLLEPVYRRRRSILLIVIFGSVLGAAVSLLMPSVYKAQTRIVPSNYLSDSSELAAMSQLRGAAGLLGFNIGGASMGNPSPLFPELLASREVTERVLAEKYTTSRGQEVDLYTFFRVKETDEERRHRKLEAALGGAVHVGADLRSGVSTISVRTRDAKVSAALANRYARAMDLFIQELKTSRAGERVRFITSRLAEVQKDLGAAETALSDFRLRNRLFSQSPQLLLEESRLARDVSVNEQLFLTLKNQLEIARIEQVKNLPDVLVIESAAPPLYRDSPKRKRVVLMAAGLSLLLGTVGAGCLDWLKSARTALREREIG